LENLKELRQRVVELKWYVQSASAQGLKLPGAHGGGWVRLAMICGSENINTKAQARAFLLGKYGQVPKAFLVSSGISVKPKVAAVFAKPVKKRNHTVTTDRFYLCREWRELRYRALATYGNKCQCCGAGPEDGAKIHVDHIKPRSTHRHLQLEFSNLQILCDSCNIGKSNLDSTDWRERMDAENIAHLRVIK
jgi:5-methylcytosine-specific restriction endonuclease McrA